MIELLGLQEQYDNKFTSDAIILLTKQNET